MSRNLQRRLERLESDLPVSGALLLVRFESGTPTHWLAKPESGGALLRIGTRRLAYLLAVHVPAEWVLEPSTEGYRPLPEDVHEEARKLLADLGRLQPGQHRHWVGTATGPLDAVVHTGNVTARDRSARA